MKTPIRLAPLALLVLASCASLNQPDRIDDAGDLWIATQSGLARYESVFTGPPSAVEAALFEVTLASLEDGSPTTLSGALAAEGDVTGSVAWDLTLGPGATLLLSQDQAIHVAPIPEPAAALLVAAGLAALGATRRGHGGNHG